MASERENSCGIEAAMEPWRRGEARARQIGRVAVEKEAFGTKLAERPVAVAAAAAWQGYRTAIVLSEDAMIARPGERWIGAASIADEGGRVLVRSGSVGVGTR